MTFDLTTTDIFNRHDRINSIALGITVKAILRYLVQNGTEGVSLRNLPVDQVNGMHLAVALRATFMHRMSVDGWFQALLVARQALERDGFNADDALSGLE